MDLLQNPPVGENKGHEHDTAHITDSWEGGLQGHRHNGVLEGSGRRPSQHPAILQYQKINLLKKGKDTHKGLYNSCDFIVCSTGYIYILT